MDVALLIHEFSNAGGGLEEASGMCVRVRAGGVAVASVAHR